MGEQTMFNPGDHAPNDGEYIETGDRDRVMGINDPGRVMMRKGEAFPNTKNDHRKWVKK